MYATSCVFTLDMLDYYETAVGQKEKFKPEREKFGCGVR